MGHLSMSTQVAQKWASDSVAGPLPSRARARTQQGFDFFAWHRLSQANPIPHLSNAPFSPTASSVFNCCPILLIKILGKFYTYQVLGRMPGSKGIAVDPYRQPALQKAAGAEQ